jgi:hypothetical protein
MTSLAMGIPSLLVIAALALIALGIPLYGLYETIREWLKGRR